MLWNTGPTTTSQRLHLYQPTNYSVVVFTPKVVKYRNK